MRLLFFCAVAVFFTPHLDGRQIQNSNHLLEAESRPKPDSLDFYKSLPSVSESPSEDMKLIVATGVTLEGGDGWRVKYGLGVGGEKQLLYGLSIIGFLDYARFDYHALQTLHPPYRTDPSHTLSVATVLKAYVPWDVSPFLQVGLGMSYVNEGTLYYHDQYRYPPTPATDYIAGGRSGLTYLLNIMVGVEFHPFKEFSVFLEGGLNGNWQKDLYPANSSGRLGIGLKI